MKRVPWATTLSVMILVAGAFVLGATLFGLSGAVADRGDGRTGRYQIASWSSFSGARTHHSGYYVLDTVTGKVVARDHEAHGIGNEQ